MTSHNIIFAKIRLTGFLFICKTLFNNKTKVKQHTNECRFFAIMFSVAANTKSTAKMITSLKKTAQFIFSFSILIIALWRCNSNSQKVDIDKNITAVKKYHEAWSNGNTEEFDKIIAPNFKSHFIGGFEYEGIEGAKNSVPETKKAFPDWKEEIVDIIAQDDKVVTRYHSTGTQLGNWDGIDSTGNNVDIYEASIYRLEKGKIVEQWGFWDEINLKKQMTVKSIQSK